eukprot:m.462066 g.462066  ORF g.462066 m.462066 type:complete len:207 (-) comp21601_c1_seq10:233-853(-)
MDMQSSTWVPAPSAVDAPGPDASLTRCHTVTIIGSFAVDGLERPLSTWLHRLLGISPALKIKWAPYSNLLASLPPLLCGPQNGGAELVLVLVRLEDLCIVHPESRYAPLTKKNAAVVAAEKSSADKSNVSSRDRTDDATARALREKYGCADLTNPAGQLLDAVRALDVVLTTHRGSDVVVQVLVCLPQGRNELKYSVWSCICSSRG